MNTKRVNNEFHRLDVKLPIELYQQISTIAVNSFSAKVHHRSGKPEITSTLIYLLELGVQSFTSGNELEKKSDTDNYTDTIPITNEDVEEIVNSAILSHFLKCHDDLVSKSELVALQEKIDELSAMIKTDNYTDNDTDKINDSEMSILPLSEDEGVIVPKTEEKVNNGDILLLIANYQFPAGEIENIEELASLCSEVLGKKIKVKELSRIANKQEGFIMPSEFWVHFGATKKGNKWVWEKIK